MHVECGAFIFCEAKPQRKRDSSCSYFDGNGSDLRNQTLVIKREGGKDCLLNKTTPNGVAVPCAGNATATRVNDTHVLLKTNDNLSVKLMEYGRDNEPGKFSEPIAADCPYSPEVLKIGESPHGHPHQHYGIYAAVVLVIIILCLIAFLIWTVDRGWVKRSADFWS